MNVPIINPIAPGTTPKAPRLFISHSHHDQTIATQLDSELRALGIDSWCAERTTVGQSFVGEIDRALSGTSHLVLLHSERSAESEWVRREWQAALAGNIEVLPVLLDDTPLPFLLGPDLALRADGEQADVAGRIAEAIKGTASQRTSRPDVVGAYLARLVRVFESWSERYTDLRLTADIRVATYKGHRIDAPNHQWWFRDALDERQHGGRLAREIVVLLGDPGAGKSTACQRMAWELARDALRSTQPGPTRIPVYYELKGFRPLPAAAGQARHQPLFAALIAEFNTRLAATSLGAAMTGAQLQKLMTQQPFCFFFDGLNEVGRTVRKELIAQLKDFVETFANDKHQFVITTRKFDYEYDLADRLPHAKFRPLEILELNSSGVREFLLRDVGQLEQAKRLVAALSPATRATAEKALESLVRGSYEGDHPLDIVEDIFGEDLPPGTYEPAIAALDQADELIAKLEDPEYERVLYLAQNPGTLKDVIDVYRHSKRLPKSRMKLFQEAIMARLAAQKSKQDFSRFEHNVKLAALGRVATAMMKPDSALCLSREQTLAELRAVVKTKKIRMPAGEERKVEELLLDELVLVDGLLVEASEDQVSFVKQPYQEFFVARHLAECWSKLRKTHANPLEAPELQEQIADRSNFQVVAGMAGLLHPAELPDLVAKLRRKRHTRRLASLCIRHGEELSAKNLSDFTGWIRRRIERLVAFPDGVSNLGVTALLLVAVGVAVARRTSWVEAPSLLTIFPEDESSLLVRLWKVGIPLLSGVMWLGIVRAKRGKPPSELPDNLLPAAILGMSLAVAFGFVRGNLAAAALASSAALFLFLSARVALLVAERFTSRANVWLEELVVHHYLIPHLEMLRDMGPRATAVITDIREKLDANRFVSDRIKDALRRAWAQSPKTALQVLDDLDNEERQAECAQVLADTVLSSATSVDLRERATAGLCRLAHGARPIGARLLAVSALARVAREYTSHRDNLIGELDAIISEQEHAIEVRQEAWKGLHRLGIRRPYPRMSVSQWLKRHRTLLLAGATLVGMIWLWASGDAPDAHDSPAVQPISEEFRDE